MKRFTLIICGWIVLFGTAHAEGWFKERVEVMCGSHRVAIACGKARADDPVDGADVRICVHNVLSFVDAEGKVFVPSEPKNAISLGAKGNSASMFGCGKSREGLYFVQVRYEGCPFGTCEMYELFTESGKRLTVNGSHLNKIVREKSIKFSETGWLSIEAPDLSRVIP